MNGKIRIRHIYKATELKRFHKLEGKYHHMGKTHSGGDTMRVVFEDENGKWLALMGGANSVKAVWRFGERLTMAQRRKGPCPAGSRSTGSSSRM